MYYLSKILTFMSGCAATVAAYGVAGSDSGVPKWLIVTCIVMTGGFAKASTGMIPPTKPPTPPVEPASGTP